MRITDKTVPKSGIKPVLLVLCSVPDRNSAELIANRLVETRLAACVSILPGITSIYRWNNSVEKSSELMLAIKCSSARLKQIIPIIQSIHPYELPEIIAVKIAGGSAEYIDWITQETA